MSVPPARPLTLIIAGLAASLPGIYPGAAFAWGEEGHEVVALIAEHYLQPRALSRAQAILAADHTGLTHGKGLAAEASWADKFRDSDRGTTGLHYRQTQEWHYVDIEIDAPDLDAACYGHPALPGGTEASLGPAHDCIVDKIDEFRDELESAATPPDERRLALQFLLHLIGDLHQPLHASDRHDRGGNDVNVELEPHRARALHYYWDTVFVEALGRNARDVANALIAEIGPRKYREWSRGSPADWARESFELGKSHVYGALPGDGGAGTAGGTAPLALEAGYAADARKIVALQLERAGVRLAWVLNDALR